MIAPGEPDPGRPGSVSLGPAPSVPAGTEIEARAIAWIRPYSQALHLERARDWLVYLDRSASLEMRLAAVTHDIERMFPGGPVFDKRHGRWDDPHYLYAHAARSAEFAGRWLRAQGEVAAGVRIDEVGRLVTLHEFGGLGGADLVQAGDSLSFLETLQDTVSGWVLADECDIAQGRAKHQYMADRIRISEASRLAVPLLAEALAALDAAVGHHGSRASGAGVGSAGAGRAGAG